jgi:hypothetical protein
MVTTDRNALPAMHEWETMLSMGEVLLKSGMLPQHIKTAAAAVALITKGRELGIPPMYALSNIAVIQGKPTANAELMLALIYRDHGDRAITFPESDGQACTIAYKRRNWPEAHTYAFTLDDAKQAGLMSNATWQKYPAAMLRARCISAVARMAFPDSIGGMYTPEELGAEVDEDGAPVIEPAPIREIRPASTPVEQPVRATVMNTPRTPEAVKKLWALAVKFYGDRTKAETALHEWIGVQYPDALVDGKPSIRALSAEQIAEMIQSLDEGIAEEQPIESEAIETESEQ